MPLTCKSVSLRTENHVKMQLKDFAFLQTMMFLTPVLIQRLSRLIRLVEYEENGRREEALQKNWTSKLNYLYEFPPFNFPQLINKNP